MSIVIPIPRLPSNVNAVADTGFPIRGCGPIRGSMDL